VRRSKNAPNNPWDSFIWERQTITFTVIILELVVIRKKPSRKECCYMIKWF
jgi:hypothetical protein